MYACIFLCVCVCVCTVKLQHRWCIPFMRVHRVPALVLPCVKWCWSSYTGPSMFSTPKPGVPALSLIFQFWSAFFPRCCFWKEMLPLGVLFVHMHVWVFFDVRCWGLQVQRDKSKVAALLPRRSSLTGIVNLGSVTLPPPQDKEALVSRVP